MIVMFQHKVVVKGSKFELFRVKWNFRLLNNMQQLNYFYNNLHMYDSIYVIVFACVTNSNCYSSADIEI